VAAQGDGFFRDRRVVILPDADVPGRKHAEKIARALAPVATSIKVVGPLPKRNDGSDVSDWLATDAVGVKLIKEVNRAPEWNPSAGNSSGWCRRREFHRRAGHDEGHSTTRGAARRQRSSWA
jgi:hypothetical protein